MNFLSQFQSIKFFDHHRFNDCYIMVGADGTVLEYFTLWICSVINETDPNCHFLTSSSSWNQDYSGTLAACVDQSACDLSQYQCQCASESQCLFGRTSPVVSSAPTATIWYNHKVNSY